MGTRVTDSAVYRHLCGTPELAGIFEERPRALHGSPALIKRDNLTGFALAGNKARKLEFLRKIGLAGTALLELARAGPGASQAGG